MDQGVYAVTETHLSSRAIHDFKLGLKLAGSRFSLHHGFPVPLRAHSSVAGAYSGVGFVSSFPGRASAHSWPPELFETSRLHVASFLLGDLWVLGGVAYGYATETHRTQPILDALLDRVLAQKTGPRFVAGDWNLEFHAIPQLERLRRQGFIEVQDLRYARAGVLPQPTCKRSSRKDFLFLSPELQSLFLDVVVDDTYWADHAVISASFRVESESVPRFVWRRPQRRPMGLMRPALVAEPVASCSSPTDQFAAICDSYEAALSVSEVATGRAPLCPAERGRGRKQEVRCVRTPIAPLRKSRAGEAEPLYFGQNLRYAH